MKLGFEWVGIISMVGIRRIQLTTQTVFVDKIINDFAEIFLLFLFITFENDTTKLIFMPFMAIYCSHQLHYANFSIKENLTRNSHIELYRGCQKTSNIIDSDFYLS